ncbi:myrosinase 1 [Pogonomyrmex barbatus]|uniref:Myrosinase 1 n=1 Tax=Pogonomyrmex barbatus TaxID=144034 RepID=A0A6I9WRC8_9HYME|nr:myrosinase 1 [Pogonomyrmex barbatus]
MARYSFFRVTFSFTFVITYGFANDTLSFPKDFLFGVSTAAYQVEGAWNISGKGISIWDRWTHDHPNLIRDGSNGDVACDTYHKYKEDVQILKNIGVAFYRFSLSWTRILPTGYPNNINQEGLNYYKNLINELLANGIEPYVTLYHWDHPDIFETMGGWTNEMMVEWISNYARVVFKELGPKIKYFITLNEPGIFCDHGYTTGIKAPGKKLGRIGQYLCVHNMLKAHARIYHIYNKEFRNQQKGQIGIVSYGVGLFPKNASDIAAVDIAFQFICGWINHPIFSQTGDYPAIMKTRIAESSKLDGFPKSILPVFSPEWVQYIKGTSDFFGINIYTSKIVETVPRINGQPWYEYSGIKKSVDPSWPKTALPDFRIVPAGFRQLLNKITTEYNRPPIFIFENGFSDSCCTYDYARISFLNSYMKEMLAAIKKDNCNVKAYTVWNLFDDFEWEYGYTLRFGLVSVDHNDPNRTRTPKLSMDWYKQVIKSRKLENS